ncbi:hypothetical protein KHM83_03715 [Fusibacter paucivorans]|uniref:FlgN protein n=1 Tax=Fusibacter paucivorans TaxID=76009 RepID=A0ABS5PMG3_9FIRM|nr:hypothetical protein [Fusibacter paucivorans]MBS7525781.1 hypothetical protein [Fusibacter paucivorans]
MSIDVLEEVLIQKIALLESTIKNVHQVIKAQAEGEDAEVLMTQVEAIKAARKQIHQLDLVFLTAYERFLKSAEVDAPEKLPKEIKQQFKKAQQSIVHIQDLTAIFSSMEASYDAAAEDIQKTVAQQRKFDSAQRAYRHK